MTHRNAVDVLRVERYRRACWWLGRGVEVVPLKPRSKQLQRGYGPRSARIAGVDLARRWFLNTDANLGVVLGGDAGLAVADWDSMHDYKEWRGGLDAPLDTLVERTARGYHFFFVGEDLASATGNGCEFKASGVCMVSPSVHPSGVVYRIVNDAAIAILDQESVYAVFPFLSQVRTRKRSDRIISHGRAIPANGSVVARIKAARPTTAEMETAGIELHPGGRSALIGLCPFHDDHHPSLWVNPESGLWGCNKPSCLAAGIHDVINFRALAQGISNAEAIRQLAREFL